MFVAKTFFESSSDSELEPIGKETKEVQGRSVKSDPIKTREILSKFQKGETSETEALKAMGKEGHIRYGLHPDQVDTCIKPEFDVKIQSFSFYTKSEGKIAVYFSFTPDNQERWNSKINIEDPGESGFSGRNII